MTRAATPAEIEAWWQRWPGANVGVVTGWVSALVVLDVDPRHDGDRALAALEDRHAALPATVTSATGGGGRHLWFAHPAHLVPSRPLRPGLDVKAEGGMVVAPPSVHASGDLYRWCPGRAPDEQLLAPLPGWLEEIAVAVEHPSGPGRQPPLARTPSERSAFRSLWADVGVDLGSDEVMVLCPFHDDHRPSLHVDPDGCRWFCFGCRRGGGIQALRRLVHPGGIPRDRPRTGTPIGEPTLAADVAVDVVGESAYQENLLALTGGTRTWSGVRQVELAELVPRADNAYDPAAVEVVVDGRAVGYLGRTAARAYRPFVDAAIAADDAATCLAEIRGGWERGHGDVGRFGVVVFLPRVEP
jgi:hypothetical protein